MVLPAMFKTNRLTSPWFWAALICFVWVGCAYSVGSLAQEHETTTAHFTPPEGCVPDPRIAVAARAVQACIERFSPTHEFIIALRVRRYRPPPDIHVSKESAQEAVEEHVAELRETNRRAPGQTVLSFEHIAPLPGSFPPGADYCELVNFAQIDRRVPGYEGQEFRIWGESFICARADLATDTMELLDLRTSERFRVATDDFKERFPPKQCIPCDKAADAGLSLRFK